MAFEISKFSSANTFLDKVISYFSCSCNYTGSDGICIYSIDQQIIISCDLNSKYVFIDVFGSLIQTFH